MRIGRTGLSLLALAVVSTAVFAQQMRQGVVSKLDEVDDTIAITETPSETTGEMATQVFKVQDGLAFNAFKEGDRVSYAIQDVGGIKTITNLERQ